MAIEYKLEVQKRDQYGKKYCKNIRKTGSVPGIYYSSDSSNSIPFAIEKSVIRNAVKSGARLYSVSVGGKSRTVLFKNVQYHPVTEEILHVDLYGVNMNKKIQINVPLELIGDPKGVKQEGGNLMQSVLELDIICLPSDIPEKIETDITELGLGENIQAGGIKLPKNIDLGMPEDTVLASISHAMSDAELESDVSEEDDISFEDNQGDSSESSETESSNSDS
tara:strand:+ start:2662 stop:3327 length:666 start_codon:yes stop_codon:yes gene_type:complete